jgi:hypothetical protein
LKTLLREANAAYEMKLYNAAAVLCRRVMEILIVAALEHHGEVPAVRQNNGRLSPLGQLIAATDTFDIPKDVRDTMEQVRELGNEGAHERHVPLEKNDFDVVRQSYRRMVLVLCQKANLPVNTHP